MMQFTHIINGQSLQELFSTISTDKKLSHMRHIEQARRFAGMLVFLEDAGWIIERQLVSGKGDHFRTQLEVQCMKRG